MLVARVPTYAPESIAEHAAALLLSLSRKIHLTYARTRMGNFALSGLLGFQIHGKTVGVNGTGNIGLAAIRIFKGFGARRARACPILRLLVLRSSNPSLRPRRCCHGCCFVLIHGFGRVPCSEMQSSV